MRGAFVVPQLLKKTSVAVLTSSSTSTINHGSANTVLTLTGSNFIPGAAVTWNGGYRTISIVDATHLSISVPSSDLATPGIATVIATKPGAIETGAISLTVQ